MYLETMEFRNPARWPEWLADMSMSLIRRYVYRWSNREAPKELSPEARDEIASRIIFDIMTAGEIPDGMTVRHYVFSVCRRWRIRNWNGDCELDAARKRRERGLMTGRVGRNDEPYSGASIDARMNSPFQILSALEIATGELILSPKAIETREARGQCEYIRGGLYAVSDRQAKNRRKAVKSRCRIVTVCEIESRATDRTYITFRKIRLATTRHIGTIANRDIGKVRLSIPSDEARETIVRDPHGQFIPAPIPAPRPGWKEFRPARENETRRVAAESVGEPTWQDVAAAGRMELDAFIGRIDAQCEAHGIG